MYRTSNGRSRHRTEGFRGVVRRRVQLIVPSGSNRSEPGLFNLVSWLPDGGQVKQSLTVPSPWLDAW